jgi:hypothetical protein
MASNVKYAVSATPIVEVTNSEASGTWSAIAKDVGKTLGGSGSVTCNWGTTIGYTDGDPAHVVIGAAEATLHPTAGAWTGVKFVYIKHSGYEEDAKETVTESTLNIYAGDVAGGALFATLGPGDAVVLPFATAGTPVLSAESSSGNIAVEVMGTA